MILAWMDSFILVFLQFKFFKPCQNLFNTRFLQKSKPSFPESSINDESLIQVLCSHGLHVSAVLKSAQNALNARWGEIEWLKRNAQTWGTRGNFGSNAKQAAHRSIISRIFPRSSANEVLTAQVRLKKASVVSGFSTKNRRKTDQWGLLSTALNSRNPIAFCKVWLSSHGSDRPKLFAMLNKELLHCLKILASLEC